MVQSFIFYESFKRQLDELDDDDKLRFYEAIVTYGIDGIEPNFSGIAKALWLQFKFVIDETAARRNQNTENGKKGGRPTKYVNKEVQAQEVQFQEAQEVQKVLNENNENNTDNAGFEVIEKTENNPIKPKITDLNPKKPNPNINVNGNENENENENDSPPQGAGHSPPRNLEARKTANTSPDSESLRLSHLLCDLHKKYDAKYNPSPKLMEQWAADIEKLHWLDNRDYADIESVIRWVKSDGNFWLSNIMCGAKLREKFPRLFTQMTQSKGIGKGKGNAIAHSNVDIVNVEEVDIPF